MTNTVIVIILLSATLAGMIDRDSKEVWMTCKEQVVMDYDDCVLEVMK